MICGRIAIGYYCSTLYILPLRGRALHLLGQQVCYVIPPLWASVVTGDTQWLEVVLVVVMLPALCGGLVGLAQEMIVLWLASRFAEMETHHRLEVERATKDAQATERTLHKERKAMVRNFKESLCNHRATEAMYASVLERLLKVQREVARERDVMRLQAAKHTNASPSSSPGSPTGFQSRPAASQRAIVVCDHDEIALWAEATRHNHGAYMDWNSLEPL